MDDAHSSLGAQPNKSDPIDALAVARAARREPDLAIAIARLDWSDPDLRPLSDHREALAGKRNRVICRLPRFLHERDLSWELKACSLDRIRSIGSGRDRIARLGGTAAAGP
jgi:hypothetical protein